MILIMILSSDGRLFNEQFDSLSRPAKTSACHPGLKAGAKGRPSPPAPFVGPLLADFLVVVHRLKLLYLLQTQPRPVDGVLKDGVFTTINPPGSILTSPNWISPQKAIVGSYNDASGASHGFILDSPDGFTLLAVLLIAPGGSKVVKTPVLDNIKL